MGKEEIVERIREDASAEAEEIIRAAKEQANEIISAANARAAEEHAAVEAEAAERANRITDGKNATARLDSQKILLAEKRRVITEIYARAHEKLKNLNEQDSLALLNRLLVAHAENGDEIVLAEDFRYASGAKKLPVVEERRLTFAEGRAPIDGGCILRGKTADKDLSYAALLAADTEENQASIAQRLFQNK